MRHEKTIEILNNLDTFHASYYEAEIFRGPSLYFHHRALNSRNCCDTFAEASYAMLASWGMHRMGPSGSKMKYFDAYKASLNRLWPEMQKAAQFNASELNNEQWGHLKNIFCSLDVMASETSLVGNSKVMAHALPHLIAPIDRQYTLTYLCGNASIKNDKEKEWERLKELMTRFFLPVATAESFTAKVSQWTRENFPWDTSPLKIVDNLLIGAVKSQPQGEQGARVDVLPFEIQL
jgi:hypothetical protein